MTYHTGIAIRAGSGTAHLAWEFPAALVEDDDLPVLEGVCVLGFG